MAVNMLRESYERDPTQPARKPSLRVVGRPTLPRHLRALESEGVHVLREVAACFERPVLLFSGGKDSIVLLRLA
ncbi:MAG: hypothetical protein ABSC56_14495, partial [Solirubrobacteraceae bacterium]